MARQLLVMLLVVVTAGACAGARGRTRDPRTVVSRWNAAVRANNPRAAYALLAEETRKELPYQDFLAAWRANADERARQTASLTASSADAAQLHEAATVKLPDGEVAQLVRDPGGWHVDVPLMASLHAETPQAALRFFAAAIRKRDIDGVMRVMSKKGRQRMNQLFDSLNAGVVAHLGGEIEVSRNRAQLRWKTRHGTWRITMVKEEGEWRVEDIIPPRPLDPIQPPE